MAKNVSISEYQFPYNGPETDLILKSYPLFPYTTSEGDIITRGVIDSDQYVATSAITVADGIATGVAFDIYSTVDGTPDIGAFAFVVYNEAGDRIRVLYKNLKIPNQSAITFEELAIFNNGCDECACDGSRMTDAEILALINNLVSAAVTARTNRQGTAKSSYASVNVDDPIHVANNDPITRALRETRVLEEWNGDLEEAIEEIGATPTVLKVSKFNHFTRTADTITVDDGIEEGETYEIIDYRGPVAVLASSDSFEILEGGSGHTVTAGIATTGGTGTNLTVEVTGIDGSGAVTGVIVDNPGQAYSEGDLIEFGNALIRVRYIDGDDFTNVGAAGEFPGFPYNAYWNRKGTIFTATGDTPTDWTHGTVLRKFLTVPDHITVVPDGPGSLRATGDGGGIYIKSLKAPSGAETIFTSDGSGKIIIDQRSVIESDVRWWGHPTGADDNHTFQQAFDSLNRKWSGGMLAIPGYDWKVLDKELPNYSIIKGTGAAIDSGGGWATEIAPSDEDEEHVGVFKMGLHAQGTVLKYMTVTSNLSTTVAAMRTRFVRATAQNFIFDNVCFETKAATSGAVPLTSFIAENSFHEFVNLEFNRCSWTVQTGSECMAWESSNSVGLFLNCQYRCGSTSKAFHGRYTGFLTWIQPEFRGDQSNLTTSHTTNRTVTSAASITGGTKILNLTEDYITSGASFTKADLHRIVTLPGKTFEGRAFTYIRKINTAFQVELAEMVNTTATNVTLTIAEVNDYATASDTCFLFEEEHLLINVVGATMEGFNYYLRDKAADYTEVFNDYGSAVAAKCLFENGASSVNFYGSTLNSGVMNITTGPVAARMFGGAVRKEVIPRYEQHYAHPNFRNLDTGEAWHLVSVDNWDWIFCSAVHEGSRINMLHNMVREPTTFLNRNQFGGPAPTDPQVAIFSPNLASSTNKMLLRLGNSWYGSEQGRFYVDFYRDTVDAATHLKWNQTGFERLVLDDASFHAEEEITTDTFVQADTYVRAEGQVVVGANDDDSAFQYGLGCGASVSQSTNHGTTVVIDKQSGVITTQAGNIVGGGFQKFTVTNNTITLRDQIECQVIHIGGSTVRAFVESVANGSFVIVMENYHASVAENQSRYITFSKGIRARTD